MINCVYITLQWLIVKYYVKCVSIDKEKISCNKYVNKKEMLL